MKYLWRLLDSMRVTLSWLPIIWRDRQWDYVFLLKILRHKLLLMQRFYGNERRAQLENAQQNALEIQRVIEVVDRLIADEYLGAELEPHEARWGVSVINPDYRGESVLMFPLATKAEQAQALAEFRAACKVSDVTRQLDWVKLWRYLNDKAQGWWD